MLSITIIELSIIIPTPRINPESEIMLMLTENISIKNNDMINEAGMLIAMSHGSFRFRITKNITITASIMPNNKVCSGF